MSKEKLTQEKLKEYLHYNRDTGIFTWKVDLGNYQYYVGDIAGGINSEGYIRITICGKEHLAHRLAVLYVEGYLPENWMDHIDRVRDNNKYNNLREVSFQCSARNRGMSNKNTSGVTGVSWIKRKKLWESRIMAGGKSIYLGKHRNFSDAVCARLAAEQCLDWSGCDSSSPAYRYVQKMLKITAISRVAIKINGHNTVLRKGIKKWNG